MGSGLDIDQQPVAEQPPAPAKDRTDPKPDAGPTLQQQAGNQAMHRSAGAPEPANSATAAINFEFDPARPWFIPVPNGTDPAVVKEFAYGDQGGEVQLVLFPAGFFKTQLGYIIRPEKLRPARRAQYEAMISMRKTLLDLELDSDIAAIKEILDMPDMVRHAFEEKVISKLWRWALEPFRSRPPRSIREMYCSQYLDSLLLKLGMASKDVGWIASSWTSYYDMLFNRLDRSDEVENIRDTYSRDFVGEKPMHETKVFGIGKDDFFGMFWEDVKSGAVADRIGNYFSGMLDTGKGLLEGVYTLITDPKKALEGIANLPHNIRVMWRNRDKIWNDFVNAPPDKQARMIGRIFGEAEIIIATVEAGGGPRAASATPELAVAEEVVPMGGNAAALAGGGAAIPLDLGKLGTEATRSLAVMATATEGGSGTAQKSEELTEREEAAPSGSKSGKGSKIEPYEKELERIPESPEAVKAREKLARDFADHSLPEGSEVRARRTQRTEAGRAQEVATGLDAELDITLPDGTRFSPDGVKYVGRNKYVFLEHKEVLTIWEKSHFSRATTIPELDAMLARHAEIFSKLKPNGCAGFFYSTGSSELANLLAERIALMPRWAREALSAPPLP